MSEASKCQATLGTGHNEHKKPLHPVNWLGQPKRTPGSNRPPMRRGNLIGGACLRVQG